MARQRFCDAPLALRTLTHPRAAGARWRAGTARSAPGRRTGAIRCPAPPTRTRRDITPCAPAAVPQVMPNGTMPNETTRPVRRCSGESTTSIRRACVKVRTLDACLVPLGIGLPRNMPRVPAVPMPNETTTRARQRSQVSALLHTPCTHRTPTPHAHQGRRVANGAAGHLQIYQDIPRIIPVYTSLYQSVPMYTSIHQYVPMRTRPASQRAQSPFSHSQDHA